MFTAKLAVLTSIVVAFFFMLSATAQGAVTLDSTAPSLAWASCWGGQDNEATMSSVVDRDGNTFVVGTTASSNLPVPNGFDTTYHNVTDNFVAKFTSDGQLAWATYLGGSSAERWGFVAVDGKGNVIVGGETKSADFPTLKAFQSTFGGGQDDYVAKFSTDGELLWSTFLGGDGDEYMRNVTINKSDAIFVTGSTGSSDFPGHGKTLSAHGERDGLVAKLSSNGRLEWSALVGGSGMEMIHAALFDKAGFITVTGSTQSSDLDPVHGFQKAFGGGLTEDGGGGDAFVARLNPAGHVMWSSYFGGSGSDFIYDAQLDAAGNLYIAGVSSSPDLPGVDPAVSAYGGGVGTDDPGDGFVAKITRHGRLLWTTYLGGARNDDVSSFAILPDGNLFVAGNTTSQEWPEPRTYTSDIDCRDVFAAAITPDGSPLWIKLFGGSGDEWVTRVFIDDVGNVYLIGTTYGEGFPIVGGLPSTNGDGRDVYVMRVSSSGDVIWSSLIGGSDVEYCETVARDGRGSLIVTGRTWSQDFPATASFQTGFEYYSDVFVIKVDNPDTLPLSYGTTPSPRSSGAPTFTFEMQPGIVKPRIRFSTSPDFSTGAAKMRFAPLKRTATSWKPAKGQWNVLRRFAGQGTLYWRIEGKNREGRTVYSETLPVTATP